MRNWRGAGRTQFAEMSGRALAIAGRQLVLGLVAAAVMMFGAGTALAHNVIVGSDPADGASLATGPSQVTLRFDLPVQQSFNTITVVGPDGSHFEDGDPKVEGSTVSVPVKPLGPAGVYTIGYRVVSDDGHPVTGSISFTLTQPGPGQGTSAAASAPGPGQTDDTGGMPVWPWVLGGIVLLGAGGWFALRAGRDTK